MTEFLTEQAALDYLEVLAMDIPADQAIVELGTHQGGSLLYLARGANTGEGAEVYGVDPWGLQGAYPANPRMRRVYGPYNQAYTQGLLDEHGLTATLIRGFSVEVARAWTGPKVGLLYVDAVHNEAAVLADYGAWLPHLAERAWVCFDDHNVRYPGVVAAVSRLDLERVGLVGTRLMVCRLET